MRIACLVAICAFLSSGTFAENAESNSTQDSEENSTDIDRRNVFDDESNSSIFLDGATLMRKIRSRVIADIEREQQQIYEEIQQEKQKEEERRRRRRKKKHGRPKRTLRRYKITPRSYDLDNNLIEPIIPPMPEQIEEGAIRIEPIGRLIPKKTIFQSILDIVRRVIDPPKNQLGPLVGPLQIPGVGDKVYIRLLEPVQDDSELILRVIAEEPVPDVEIPHFEHEVFPVPTIIDTPELVGDYKAPFYSDHIPDVTHLQSTFVTHHSPAPIHAYHSSLDLQADASVLSSRGHGNQIDPGPPKGPGTEPRSRAFVLNQPTHRSSPAYAPNRRRIRYPKIGPGIIPRHEGRRLRPVKPGNHGYPRNGYHKNHYNSYNNYYDEKESIPQRGQLAYNVDADYHEVPSYRYYGNYYANNTQSSNGSLEGERMKESLDSSSQATSHHQMIRPDKVFFGQGSLRNYGSGSNAVRVVRPPTFSGPQVSFVPKRYYNDVRYPPYEKYPGSYYSPNYASFNRSVETNWSRPNITLGNSTRNFSYQLPIYGLSGNIGNWSKSNVTLSNNVTKLQNVTVLSKVPLQSKLNELVLTPRNFSLPKPVLKYNLSIGLPLNTRISTVNISRDAKFGNGFAGGWKPINMTINGTNIRNVTNKSVGNNVQSIHSPVTPANNLMRNNNSGNATESEEASMDYSKCLNSKENSTYDDCDDYYDSTYESDEYYDDISNTTDPKSSLQLPTQGTKVITTLTKNPIANTNRSQVEKINATTFESLKLETVSPKPE